jgi:CubicO group peptidase (beta-lactamase class C family)
MDLLGLIIEKTTGESYEAYINEHVLSPMGISRVAVGRGLPEERLPNEVIYYDYPHAPLVRSIYPNTRRLMPRPYAFWQMEHGMVPAGGWIASAVDLVRFNARLDGLRAPALLKPSTIQLMLEPPPAPPLLSPRSDTWYGLAWCVSPYTEVEGALNWWHGGYFPGSRADLVRLGNGVVFAALFNSDSPDANSFTVEFQQFLVDVSLNTQNWPTHDLFSNYYPGE